MAIPSISNNTPSPGHISWGAFTIQLNGVHYSVPAASSDKRWVWWEYNGGTPILNAGPDVPQTLTDDDLVLFANKNGIGVRVQSTNFVDGELLVDGSIFAEALSTNLINSEHIVTAGLDAGVIKFGEMSGDRIMVNTLNGDTVMANTLAGDRLIANTVHGDTIMGNTIVGDKIAANTIGGDRIIANTITGDHLNADVVLATSRIAALGAEGQSVEMNPGGFFVYGPTSEGRPAYVSFPTDASSGKPNIISGTLQATTLSVDGNAVTGQAATFRKNSQFEPGATLTLNNAVVAPVAEPSGIGYERNLVSLASSASGQIVGAAYHPGQNAIYFVTASQSGATWTNRVYKIDLATNTMSFVHNVTYGSLTDVGAHGITFFGGHFYIGYYQGGNILLARYAETDWSQVSSGNFGAVGGGRATFTIGTDGTDIWVGDYGSTTANCFRFRRYAATLATNVLETVNTTSKPDFSAKAESNFNALLVGNFDLGAKKFMAFYTNAWDSGAANVAIGRKMYAFTAAGTREATSEFTMMQDESDLPVIWKGTSHNDATGSFIDVCQKPTVTLGMYSKLVLSGTSQAWYVGTSFYRDSDGAETTLSPMAYIVSYSRWYWKITVTSPPSGLSTRVYISRAAKDPTQARLQATLAGTVTSVTGSVYDSASAVPKTSSTFGASTPSLVQSQATITTVVTAGTTLNSKTVTGAFKPYMVDRAISGSGIPVGSVITAVTDGVNATISNNATATATGVSATVTLPKLEIRGDGYARITEMESVVLTSPTDASTSAGNKPPLRVGNPSGVHLRIDGNEIISMDSDSARGGLTLTAESLTISPTNGGVVIQGGTTYGSFIRTVNTNWSGIVLDYNAVSLVNASYGGAAYGANNTTSLNVNTIQAYGAIMTTQNIKMDNPTLGSFTANVNWNSTNGYLRVVSSSAKYKTGIKPAVVDTDKILSLIPKSFQRNDEWTNDEVPRFRGYRADNPWYVGFIAEEAHALGLSDWVEYDAEGKPEGFAYANWGVALQAVVRKQRDLIADLTKRVVALEARPR